MTVPEYTSDFPHPDSPLARERLRQQQENDNFLAELEEASRPIMFKLGAKCMAFGALLGGVLGIFIGLLL